MDIVINDTRYYVPKKWNEVALGRYMDFMTTHKADASEVEQEVHLLSTLTGAPTEALGNISKKNLNKAIDRLKELMLDETEDSLVLTFEIDGVDYGFHPNLSEMKLKEFVDLDNKLEDTWSNMHFIMAILYRPITKHKGKKYAIEEYDYITASKRAKLFKKELSISLVNAAASFFLTIAVDYMKIMQAYSRLNRRQKREATRQMKNSLTKSMDGMV